MKQLFIVAEWCTSDTTTKVTISNLSRVFTYQTSVFANKPFWPIIYIAGIQIN